MPGLAEEQSFHSGKEGLVLEGVSYNRGDEIPAAVVARLPRPSVLLSNGWITPAVDPHGRRTTRHPTPTRMTRRRDHLEQE